MQGIICAIERNQQQMNKKEQSLISWIKPVNSLRVRTMSERNRWELNKIECG